jgi:hypothetical protein
MREYICYHPPKSNGWGHTLRHRTVASAWNAIQAFIDACTIAEAPVVRSLTVHADWPWDDDVIQPHYAAAATAVFGPHDDVSTMHYSSPSEELTTRHDLVWKGDRLELTSVLRFLSAQEPWPKRISDVVTASVEIPFQWRDPASGDLLAHQDTGFGTDAGALRSSLRITLGARTHIQPDLRIPFPEGSPRLPAFVQFVQTTFPTKLNPKHFGVATPNAKRTAYQFRRLIIPPTVGL